MIAPEESFPIGPVRALLDGPDDAVLAVIAGVEGPSYRPVGAMMAVLGETERFGYLSSGCIERDIAAHAIQAREAGRPEMVRYGEGSCYVDVKLPCGGGLDVLLLPNPDRAVLREIERRHAARKTSALVIDLDDGSMSVAEKGETGRSGNRLRVRFEPDILFNIFGKGPEAATFGALIRSIGHTGLLLSPDRETLQAGTAAGIPTRHLVRAQYPDDLETDRHTAVVMFFHDHDWEPPLLAGALDTPAFYIGAQGSRRARDARLDALRQMGIPEKALGRVRGPIGLVPSARDAKSLAVSVLAEILACAMPGRT